MSHIDIQDPNTGLWACWSTCVDNYISDWMPETEYRAFVLKEALLGQLVYDDTIDDNEYNKLVSCTVQGNTCVLTVNDLSKVQLHPSCFVTKEDCDKTLKFRSRCATCNHANCDDCDDNDRYEPAEEDDTE